MSFKKAHVYTAILKDGTNAQVKAYSKELAFEYLYSKDNSLTINGVKKTNIINSHQIPIDEQKVN